MSNSEEEKTLKALTERYIVYQTQPLEWVDDFFGDSLRKEFKALTGVDSPTKTGLTTDQEKAFIELGLIIAAKLKKRRGEELKGDEDEMWTEAWYATRIGISIQSGQGLGKDFFGALAMWWFLSVFSDDQGDCKCMATATSKKQLKNVFWSEMGKTASLSSSHNEDGKKRNGLLDEMFVRQSEKIFAKIVGGKKNDGETHFLEAVTINVKDSVEEQAEGIGGRHAKYMFILADEASGIQSGVFKPLEGTLTGVINLILVIFNPTRSKGYAVDSQKKNSPFLPLHWDGETSDLLPVLENRNKTLLKKYGRDSTPYRIRVRGLPPRTDADTLIPQDRIEEAVERWENNLMEADINDPWMIGVDPAAGGDSAVVLKRHGPIVSDEILRFNGSDTMVFTNIVAEVLDEHEGRYGCFIDNIGVGCGVHDRLKELRYRKIYSVDVRKRPTEEENPKFEGRRFRKLRDQLWWKLRIRFEDGRIALPPDQNLIDQLGCMKYHEENGMVVVSSKKEIKKMKISQDWESPDESDCLMMTEAGDDRKFRGGRHKTEKRKVDMKGVYRR
jgi:hypothetical protein